jgi:hypothetical protein
MDNIENNFKNFDININMSTNNDEIKNNLNNALKEFYNSENSEINEN